MRLLDLYCGEGLAAWGYWLSGRFTEIVGIDKNPEMKGKYAFDFIEGDALSLNYEFLDQFDFIHASPPCQAYSRLTRNTDGLPRLITGTRLMLHASGKPHAIENVEGAIRELRPNLSMDGHYFGLPMERRRYFYVSTLVAPLRLMNSGETVTVHGGDYIALEELVRVFGLDVINANRLKNLTRNGIKQGIAPAMTKQIVELVFPHKTLIG